MHIGGASRGLVHVVYDPTTDQPQPTATLDLAGPTPTVVPHENSGSGTNQERAPHNYEPISDLIGRIKPAAAPDVQRAPTVYLPAETSAAPTLDLRA